MPRKVALTQGVYTARSLSTSAQRCVNLYPEKNPDSTDFPYTMYPTPGLTKLATAPQVAFGRGIFLSSKNTLFAVIGNGFYEISPTWVFTLRGVINAGTTPVRMKDNGFDLVIVDGSANGWSWNFTNQTFSAINDPAFYGATAVDVLDTYLLFNKPGGRFWYTSLSSTLTPFDSTYIAGKSGNPDDLVYLFVMQRAIYLLGRQTSEVWTNVGDAKFPFAISNGVFLEKGCIAPYSVATDGTNAFWIAQNKNGSREVVVATDYRVRLVQTPAIAIELSRMGDVSDAQGFCYQQAGHTFYVLNFPSANATWVYDLGENLWHERVYLDNDGKENRWRVGCATGAFGVNLGLDWQNGNLYEIDLDSYTDDGAAIVRVRGFPFLQSNGGRVEFSYFQPQIETGSTLVSGDQGFISLRWSDDQANTWSDPMIESVGKSGEYLRQPTYWRLGIARSRVFELSWSNPAQISLQGAFVEYSGLRG